MKRILAFAGSLILMTLSITSCLVTNERYDKLTPGIWRGELFLDESNPLSKNISKVGNDQDISFKNVFTEGVLPFNFEVSYLEGDSLKIEFINGAQRISVDEILYGRNKQNGKDTIRMNFLAYDTYIQAEIEDGMMTGAWYNPRKNWRIPFRGLAGKKHRFTLMEEKPTQDLSGKWPTVFTYEDGADTALGEFNMKVNNLTGTFASTTGDYGYLDGTVQHDKIYLSKFDGGHAYLITGKIIDKEHMEGIYMSGKTGRATWKAVRDDKAQLADVSKIVGATTDKPINFSFPDASGKMVSLQDKQFQGKAKVITIMGTWCPNCKDEANFLKEYLDKNKPQYLEVIALSFEAYDNADKVNSLFTNYKKVMNIPYTVLWAGKVGKDAIKSVPFLTEIKAYPTMIFLDKQNRIVKTHTGFSGPATREYEDFKKEFAKDIEKINAI